MTTSFLIKNANIVNENQTFKGDVLIEGELIKKIGTDIEFGNMTESQQAYLKFALIQYTKFQQAIDPVGAKETISLGHQFFYEKRDDCLLDDNSDFKELYDEVTG